MTRAYKPILRILQESFGNRGASALLFLCSGSHKVPHVFGRLLLGGMRAARCATGEGYFSAF